MIDWKNGKHLVTPHFTVSDCLELPTWGRLANESDGLTNEIKANLILTCQKMEEIRVILGNNPIHVHCMFRPTQYNKIIGGSTKSKHILGLACDFSLSGKSTSKDCDDVREILVPKLEELNIRCEDLSGKTSRGWVHIDLSAPSPNRYFKP